MLQNSGAGLPATKASAAISPLRSFLEPLPDRRRWAVTAIFQKVEEPAGRIAVPAPRKSRLTFGSQISYCFDLASGEEMELFVVELSDITHPSSDARKVVALPGIIEDISLQNGQIDTRSSLRSLRFCKATLCDHRRTRRVAPSSIILARSSAMRTECPGHARFEFNHPLLATATSGSAAVLAGAARAVIGL